MKSYDHTICPVLGKPSNISQKNGCVIDKIFFLVSWSPICTSLILVLTSIKMVSISATVIYDSMRVATLDKPVI